MGEIIYNGRSSREIGLEVETYPSYQAPRRIYEKVHIPGRNGDLIIDDGSWENAIRSYPVNIGSKTRYYYEMMAKISDWLHTTTTYVRLEDSYEPEYYRLAVYLNEVAITNLFNQGGQGTLEFDCKPQRFLKIGDERIVITQSPKLLLNPTMFISLPIIHVYGSGAGRLMVGDKVVSISEIGTEIVLNSEIQDAYLGATNKNAMITIPNGFPELGVGTTAISFSGGISKVEVIPKWFTL